MEFANTLRKQEGETNILKHLVVDSGAIIKAERLEHLAENFWTVQEVLDEIRDSKSRHVLDTLPYNLKTRVPSGEAMNAIMQFARKTGDLRGLSVPDTKVLALAYMLEKEECGGVDHLRKEPMTVERMRAAMAKPGAQENEETDDAPVTAKAVRAGEAEPTGTVPAPAEVPAEEDRGVPPGPTAGAKAPFSYASMASKKPAEVKAPAKLAVVYGAAEPKTAPAVAVVETPSVAPAATSEKSSDAPYSSRILNAHKTSIVTQLVEGGEEEDDGVGWIGEHNLAELEGATWGTAGRRRNKNRRTPQASSNDVNAEANDLNRAVGCVTVDFAMQNVLMQMGLGLFSIRGVAIRRLKQWVLRCIACYNITSKMDKMFCPRCGNATMTKLSVYVGDDGSLRYGFKKNYKIKTRGTKFAIAKTKGGRRDQGLLLREDQMMTGQWRMQAKKKDKMESLFGEDIGKQFGLNQYATTGLTVGVGRRNPNAQRGRERRGKKKKNKNGRYF